MKRRTIQDLELSHLIFANGSAMNLEAQTKLDPEDDPGVVLHGYLSRRHERSERWKNLYFVLRQTDNDSRLYMYGNQTRSVLKDQIDLKRASLFQVDESMFNRKFCFQLVELTVAGPAKIHYLSGEEQTETEDWISLLRTICNVQKLLHSEKRHQFKEARSIQLTVVEANNLVSKESSNLYCVVSLDLVQTARTQIKQGRNPVFDETFELENIPSIVSSLSVNLMSKAKHSYSRDISFGSFTIAIDSLKKSCMTDEWYELSTTKWQIRLKIEYHHDLIMPEDEYAPIKELLISNDPNYVGTLGDICYSDRKQLAKSLLQVSRKVKKDVKLLQNLNWFEIDRENTANTLFRRATLATTAMDLYMKRHCTNYLRSTVLPTINKVLKVRHSLELDPVKGVTPSDVIFNSKTVTKILNQLTESIFSSAKKSPKPLRFLCNQLQREVSLKWPNDRLVKSQVVSGFIFLRLFCPALIYPEKFNLIKETPDPLAARNLIIVAKCLQNLANLVDFRNRETYMKVLDPFWTRNQQRMIEFIDDFSSVTDLDPDDGKTFEIDCGQDLHVILKLCCKYLPQLDSHFQSKIHHQILGMLTDLLKEYFNYAVDAEAFKLMNFNLSDWLDCTSDIGI